MVEKRREAVVAGSRIATVVAFLALSVNLAEAQTEVFTGMLTGYVGAVARGDVRDSSVAPGVSMAVLDENGIGVEIDFGRSGDFDTTLFAESSITSVMLNLIAMYPHERFRPFFTGGAGIMRVRVAFFPDQSSIGETDAAWTVGGGLLYMVNDALGLRGDVRYFRNFQRHAGIPLAGNGILDFVRSSVGITFAWPMQ
jgi:opacity protein-like surface antigen